MAKMITRVIDQRKRSNFLLFFDDVFQLLVRHPVPNVVDIAIHEILNKDIVRRCKESNEKNSLPNPLPKILFLTWSEEFDQNWDQMENDTTAGRYDVW